MFEIIPGILESEWEPLKEKIEAVLPFAKTIHIDVIDGKFAQNKTYLDPKPFERYTSECLFEVHLMVNDPLVYVKPFADAGFRRFLGHIEKMPDQKDFVAVAGQFGEVGLAIDGQTPLSDLFVPLHDLDTLLIMGINAGFSGQTMQKQLLLKIPPILKEDSLFPIEVDGGVNDTTIIDAYKYGARRFVTTSYLFGENTPGIQYAKLEKILTSRALDNE